MSEESDETLAASFIGKRLLIGLTYVDHEEKPVEQRQLHGRIVRITPGEGVVVVLGDSGEEFKLPPDLRSFRVAPSGEYRLRSTGEVVVDPDLTCTWVTKKPAH
jgi:hypothetical protein